MSKVGLGNIYLDKILITMKINNLAWSFTQNNNGGGIQWIINSTSTKPKH